MVSVDAERNVVADRIKRIKVAKKRFRDQHFRLSLTRTRNTRMHSKQNQHTRSHTKGTKV